MECGHRCGWDGPVKLVLGRGGVLVTQLALEVCVSPGLVGDTRQEEQNDAPLRLRGRELTSTAVGPWSHIRSECSKHNCLTSLVLCCYLGEVPRTQVLGFTRTRVLPGK